MIFLGFHAAAVRIRAGGRDGEFALGLQELQGITRLFRALLLDDGQDLVLEIALAEIIRPQSMPG